MSLFIMGDLHLGFGVQKTMDLFGAIWKGHPEKIKKNWLERVRPEDTVILAGDNSWAMNFMEAEEDFQFLESLPGKKVIIPGNHDYWWASDAKLKDRWPQFCFIKNGIYFYGPWALCITKGWVCPNDMLFTPQDEKLYKREAGRMERNLIKARQQGYTRLIALTHFPPTNDKGETSLFTEIYQKYQPEKVVFAHLHGKETFDKYQRCLLYNNLYGLVSSDYLAFHLQELLP